MVSRTPSRGRSRRPQSNSSTMPMVLGGLGLVVVVVLIVVLNSGSGDKTTDSGSPSPAKVAETPKPVAAPISLAAARAGKTPGKAAPALTTEMLQQASALLDQAKATSNDGVKARNAGDNQKARDLQSAAKVKLDAFKSLLQQQLDWQEAAQLDDWAQPAEYITLEHLYESVAKLDNQIRKGGGT